MRTEPNERLKARMRGNRKAKTMYEQMADEDIRIFLNEWADLYETNREAAISLMVRINQDRLLRKIPRIQA